MSTERQANVSREAREACLMSCWGRGPATGSQSPPLPRGKGAALFFFMKLEGAFFWFSMIRQRTHTCRGAARLCPLWLGVRSLHSFQDSEATFQEVMELSLERKLSSLTTKILGGALFFFFWSMRWTTSASFSRLSRPLCSKGSTLSLSVCSLRLLKK